MPDADARRRELDAADRSRRIRLAWWAVAIVLVAGGLAAARPQSLGGSIAYVAVEGDSMVPTLRSGDLAIVREHGEYEVGDVVVYMRPTARGAEQRMIHRIVGGSEETGFITRGDNNDADDSDRTPPDEIIGSMWVRVPGAFGWLGTTVATGVLVSVALLGLALAVLPRRRRRPPPVGPLVIVDPVVLDEDGDDGVGEPGEAQRASEREPVGAGG